MARELVKGEKPLVWVGSAKRDFLEFPEPVKGEMGNALGIAQFGGKHPSAKPQKGRGPGVFEIVENFSGDTYRAVYTVRFREEVCPPCVSEEVTKGHKDGPSGVELVEQRLKCLSAATNGTSQRSRSACQFPSIAGPSRKPTSYESLKS